MTTSGSTDFSSNANVLIQDAFRAIGVLGEGQSLSADQYNLAQRALNRMLKHWNTQSLHLWKKRPIILYATNGKQRYVLPTDRASYEDETIKTELAASAVTSATTITVDDATGISVSDQIGIELSSNVLFWSTVSSISTNTITIADPLTGSAPLDGHVYAYTTTVSKPLNLLSAQRIESDDNEITISIVSNSDYDSLANKATTDSPSQVYFQPLSTTSNVYVWPTFNSVKQRMRLNCSFQIEDIDTT